MREIAGAFERSWSGQAGMVAWTKLLLPVAGAYALVSGAARRRASRTRCDVPGAHVIAVGNLTVGGTGKSTIARWLALEAVNAGARAAVLLRGHGAGALRPGVVPDFARYPVEVNVVRYGDEAIAHRIALRREVAVGVDPDRLRAARRARDGYGARVLVLDDGWEQKALRWNELWVALDPDRPVGNGALLPAGPLRRPAATLREANRIVFLLEDRAQELPSETLRQLERIAPRVPRLRLLRTLLGTTRLGAHRRAGDSAVATEPVRGGERVALISGIGSPRRLERFVLGAGADVVCHAAFPDHARWRGPELLAAAERGRRVGAGSLWITEKDEPRWPRDLRVDLPVRVLRTGLTPLDPVEDALRSLRAAAQEAARTWTGEDAERTMSRLERPGPTR